MARKIGRSAAWVADEPYEKWVTHLVAENIIEVVETERIGLAGWLYRDPVSGEWEAWAEPVVVRQHYAGDVKTFPGDEMLGIRPFDYIEVETGLPDSDAAFDALYEFIDHYKDDSFMQSTARRVQRRQKHGKVYRPMVNAALNKRRIAREITDDDRLALWDFLHSHPLITGLPYSPDPVFDEKKAWGVEEDAVVLYPASDPDVQAAAKRIEDALRNVLLFETNIETDERDDAMRVKLLGTRRKQASVPSRKARYRKHRAAEAVDIEGIVAAVEARGIGRDALSVESEPVAEAKGYRDVKKIVIRGFSVPALALNAAYLIIEEAKKRGYQAKILDYSSYTTDAFGGFAAVLIAPGSMSYDDLVSIAEAYARSTRSAGMKRPRIPHDKQKETIIRRKMRRAKHMKRAAYCQLCDDKGDCPECGGNGVVMVASPCLFCAGQGKYNGQACEDCGGKGYEEFEKECPLCEGSGLCPECGGGTLK